MSQVLLRALKDQRDNLVNTMRGDLEACEQRDGGMTAEDDARLRSQEQTISELDQRMATVTAAIERADTVDPAVMRALDSQPNPTENPTSMDARLRSFLSGETRSVHVMPEKRALAKGATATGGATVPTTFYGRLMEHLIEVSGLLSAGPTLLETTSGETITIPVTVSHSSAALTAEGATIAASDPVFAQRTVGAYKYSTLIKISTELVTDTAVDLEGYLAREAGRACGNQLGAHLITGTGAGQPTGIAGSVSAGVTGGTGVTGAFTADNLIDLFYSVIAPYRNSSSCGWLLRDSGVATMRKLKDSAGQYLWSPSSGPGVPDSFLAKPVFTDPNVAAVGLNNKSVLFGDFSRYTVRLAGGVRFERSDDFAFDSDQVSFRAVVRGDGVLADQTGAVKAFVGAAS